MKDCQRATEVFRYVAAGEELPAGLSAHATGCSACQASLERGRRFDAELHAGAAALATPALPHLTDGLAVPPGRASLTGVLRIVGTVAAAVIAVAVVSAGYQMVTTPVGSLPTPSPTPSASPAINFTRGPVPDSARLPDGSIDRSQVPDFIPAVDGDHNIGWIWSADIMPAEGEERAEIVTVYADDLVTVVGRMFPDAGFVPLGSEDEMLPDPQRDRELTIRVRNESDKPAILEITEARDESDWSPQLIVPPILVAAGADEDVTFRSPLDRWSLNLQGDLGFFFSDDLGQWANEADFSLVVGDDRVLRAKHGS